MADTFSERIRVYNSIYIEDSRERYIQIEYGIPDKGVTESTGLLVVVPGYGGNAMSNVHRHMREEFPDKWDVIVLHCDYFGLRHMQAFVDDFVNELAEHPKVLNAEISLAVEMSEDLNDFNDMGFMQALDIVYSTKYIIDKYDANIDLGRIVLFGNSHGSYLAHIANIICPNMYSHMIDISAYMYPYYMDKMRDLTVGSDNGIVICKQYFRYLVNRFGPSYTNELYDLHYLYRHIYNRCKIIAFQGVSDWMVSCEEKKAFIDSLDNSEILVFGEDDVDGVVINDASHGLGADFLILLNMYLEIISKEERLRRDINLFEVTSIDGIMELALEGNEIKVKYIKGAKEWGEKVKDLI